MSLESYSIQDISETDLMRTVLVVAWRTSPQTVEDVAGVQTVTPYWERPEGEDCTGYVFGLETDGKAATEEVIDTWLSHAEPIPGAIAIYYFESKYPTHVGLVQENGNIVSKWTTNLFESGYVYEHLPLAVPSDYGDKVVFYTKK